jgi:hypothetical protein
MEDKLKWKRWNATRFAPNFIYSPAFPLTMKILLIHSDYTEYEVTERTKLAEEIEDSLKKGSMAEALTVFATIEKEDEGKEDEVIERGAEEIASVAGKLIFEAT